MPPKNRTKHFTLLELQTTIKHLETLRDSLYSSYDIDREGYRIMTSTIELVRLARIKRKMVEESNQGKLPI